MGGYETRIKKEEFGGLILWYFSFALNMELPWPNHGGDHHGPWVWQAGVCRLRSRVNIAVFLCTA